MEVAFLSALSAIGGSLVGGLTSGFTTWLSQRSQARAAQLAREMSRRDDLYKDFIVAASRVYGHALMNNEAQVQQLVDLYGMISRMRVMSLPRTVACAETVMEITTDTYFASNKTIHELHELMKSKTGMDPLRDFSEAARDELEAFTSV
jgi:hypothetical protein